MRVIQKKSEDQIGRFADWCVGLLPVGLFYLGLALAGHGCPVRLCTGIPCPGCGLSRAYLALLRGDPAGAFTFHPMFWAVPLILLCCFLYSRKQKRSYLALAILLGTGFVVLWLIRLISGDPLTVPEPQKGLFFRSLSGIGALSVRLLHQFK